MTLKTKMLENLSFGKKLSGSESILLQNPKKEKYSFSCFSFSLEFKGGWKSACVRASGAELEGFINTMAASISIPMEFCRMHV